MKHLLQIFLLLIITPHWCQSQSTAENLKPQRQLYFILTSPEIPNYSLRDLNKRLGIKIESITKISKIQNNDSLNSATANVIVSIDLKFKKALSSHFSKKETDSISNYFKASKFNKEESVLAALKMLKNEDTSFSKEFGSENIIAADEKIRIINIPLKLYCKEAKDRRGEVVWIVLPEPGSRSDLVISAYKRGQRQEQFNTTFPKSIVEKMNANNEYFTQMKYSEMHESEGALLRTKNLGKAVDGYYRAIKEQLGEYELEWTHPKYLAALVEIVKKEHMGFKQLNINGIINQIVKIENIDNISKIHKYEKNKYAVITLSGTLLMDMGRFKGRGGMGYAAGVMIGQLSREYGKDNVEVDKESWMITIRKIPIEVYAIYESTAPGWRFSVAPLLYDNMLVSPPNSSSQIKYSELMKQMDEKMVDYIVPKVVILNNENSLKVLKTKEILAASKKLVKTINKEDFEGENVWMHPDERIEKGEQMDEGLNTFYEFEAVDSIYEVFKSGRTVYAIIGFKGKLKEDLEWDPEMWINDDLCFLVGYQELDEEWKFIWQRRGQRMLVPNMDNYMEAINGQEEHFPD